MKEQSRGYVSPSVIHGGGEVGSQGGARRANVCLEKPLVPVETVKPSVAG